MSKVKKIEERIESYTEALKAEMQNSSDTTRFNNYKEG